MNTSDIASGDETDELPIPETAFQAVKQETDAQTGPIASTSKLLATPVPAQQSKPEEPVRGYTSSNRSPNKPYVPTMADAVIPLSKLIDPTDGSRPSYHWWTIIRAAIVEAPEQRMTLTDIYNAVGAHFVCFNDNDETWKNAIRHNLSVKPCFKRDKRDNEKGSYWVVDHSVDPAQGRVRVRKNGQKYAKRATSSNKTTIPDDQRKAELEQERTQQALAAARIVFAPTKTPNAPPILDAKFALAFDRRLANMIRNALLVLNGSSVPGYSAKTPDPKREEEAASPAVQSPLPEINVNGKREREGTVKSEIIDIPLKAVKLEEASNDINLLAQEPSPQPQFAPLPRQPQNTSTKPRPRPLFVPAEANVAARKIHDIANAPLSGLVPLPQTGIAALAPMTHQAVSNVAQPNPDRQKQTLQGMIREAILRSEHKRLTIPELVPVVAAKHPLIKTTPDAWTNTIRNVLSNFACFEKLQEPNEAWQVKEAVLVDVKRESG